MNLHENEIFQTLQYNSELLIDIEYENCTFHQCTFSEVTCEEITFHQCTFRECTFRALHFIKSSMRNCIFENCELVGINWNELNKMKTAFPIFSTMRMCVIKYNNFIQIDLSKIDLSNSTLLDNYFQDCNLSRANFNNCDMEKTTFQSCNLTNANFRNACNYFIDTTNNKMKGAQFSYPEVLKLLTPLQIEIYSSDI